MERAMLAPSAFVVRPDDATTARLLALEAGVVACLHELARHERALRSGRVSVPRLWRLLYTVSDLSALLLMLSAEVRRARSLP